MSVNKELPHVYILPEDDANRQLAIGFFLDQSFLTGKRTFRVLAEVGGWKVVLDRFRSDHISEMERYDQRFMVLLIDFDRKPNRLNTAKAAIPAHLTERVFILGSLSKPEDLKKANLRSYETIGKAMAKDCREETETTWAHPLLRHNAAELDRLREHVRPILFEST